jgi:TrmH family RNA methyltransferase
VAEARSPITDQTIIDRWWDARRDDGLAVLEGFHALKHALRFGAAIETACTPDRDALSRLAAALAPDVADRLDRIVTLVGPDLFRALTPNPVETGVIALARRPAADPGTCLTRDDRRPAILLERPTHLGNVGAVIRVAAAAGAAAVLTTGPQNPWHPAAIRGAAGLHFAQPVRRVDDLRNLERPLVAIDPEGEPFRPERLPASALLAFGSERRGLSDALLEQADRRLALPMQPGVSSLILATAVAAVLYGWRHAQLDIRTK